MLEFSGGEIIMDSDNQETLRQDAGTNRILEAIGDLRREMNERFGKTETRLTGIEGKLKEVKALQLSFDIRLDRLQAMTHEVLHNFYSVRADLKSLRAKVNSSAKDAMDLQQKVA
jgi:hypothetical protein